MKQNITIFTDGACQGNPGKGGYAAILSCGKLRKTISGGYRLTTNNRMELTAVLEGLRAIKGEGHRIVIYSDSQVFVKPFNSGNAARRLICGKQTNGDLWSEILSIASRHEVTAEWVKGHNGLPENEECDSLAVRAAQNATAVDTAYENGADTIPGTLNEPKPAEALLREALGEETLNVVLNILKCNGYAITRAQI